MFRPFQHRLVKKNIFGVVIVVVWITAGLFTTRVVLFFLDQLSAFKESKDILMTYYSSFLLCLLIIAVSFLLVDSYKNCLRKSTLSPWCNQQRKKTDQNTVIITLFSRFFIQCQFFRSKPFPFEHCLVYIYPSSL